MDQAPARQTIGLAIIARDEEATLPALLTSIEGAFDRVVLVDTGSEDRTVLLFQEWAQTQQLTYAVAKYEWTDNFAAARIAADELLVWGSSDARREAGNPCVDWTSWADCDDAIVNAGELRELANTAPAEVAALVFEYDYAQHPESGACVCQLRRERLVRVGKGEWLGRVHEAQAINGPVMQVPRDKAHWKHNKQAQGADVMGQSNSRNLAILTKWVEEEPENPRVVGYIGTELAIRGNHDDAIVYYKRYLELKTGWDQERAQICRRLSGSLLALDRRQEAVESALTAIAVLPSWPDSYLTLAEVGMLMGEFDKTIFHAKQALALGLPDTLLIVNPLDYSMHPHKLMAGALGGLGRWDDALAQAELALAVEPSDPVMRAGYMDWRKRSQREHTAETYLLAAQQLVAHDEQLKALTLLEDCIPHFATDHERVVAYRSFLRERLLWVDEPMDFADHYESGGSKPEDFLSDEDLPVVCAQLPRVAFLVAGLQEQMAA